MKKIVALLLAMLMLTTAFGAFAMTAGTYEGTGKGLMGEIKVAVEVTENAIVSVTVLSHNETAGIADPALDQIPAAIVANQSLVVDAVAGATYTSNGIIAATEAALIAAGADVEAFKVVEIVEDPAEVIEYTTDVVVIGAGGAGVAAAVEAWDNGAQVVLLEKTGAIGGTTATSQGMIAGYETYKTKAQDIHYTVDQMYHNLMNNASYRLDPALTIITVEKSGETIDYLHTRMGMEFDDTIWTYYGNLQMMHVVTGAGPAMKVAMQATLDNTTIDLQLNTKATEILMNADGSVKGVKAERGNDTVYVYADAVVICTGGYAYNPELTVRLDPEKEGTMGIGWEGSTGDGLIMASNVGAALTHLQDMMCVLKDYEIMAYHNGNSSTANVSSFISRDNTVLLGADGTRFCDEKDIGYMTQALNQPIFDQMHRDGLGYVWAISDVASLEAKGVVRGLGMEFITADTLEELAEKMGLPVDAVVTTLTNYNSYVAAGHDPEFGRLLLAELTAPYAAVKVMPCEIITYGGIARNTEAEVIRADGTSIAGLYTAGEASANSAYMGFTISNAFTWGRIAGENAAEFALSK
ncbi:MAG: FAD-dependent oxidoreductase [Clostridia bacterium]|nr:FAD-dependent oxidoreductase [Clostridia bacterium]